MSRTVLVWFACVVCALALVGTATAGGANNVVIVNNTADGNVATRAHVQVAPAAAPSVTSANLAIATSTACTGCTTVAVAMQALFITGDPSVVSPANVAFATNGGCNGCATFAYAFQYVVSVGVPSYLSPAGRDAVNQIEDQASADAASGIPFDLLTVELDGLAAQLKSVINTDLQQAGQSPQATSTVSVDSLPG